jgi:transcriptional regulator with XRE-family HTH domain|nr:MAG TPA: repressor protein [Caudoviricetes sp.]
MLDKIKALCKEKKTSISKLEKQLGFGNGVIGRWDKSVPSYERLAAVANALDVPVSYLTGETDDPSAGIKKERPADGEAPAQDTLIQVVRNSKDRAFLLKVMDEVNKSMQKLQ